MTSVRIDRPIFVIGTGRGGTTIFLQLLGCHPDVAWISNYTNRCPRFPQLACLSRTLDVPVLWRMLDQGLRLTPKPVESIAALNFVTENVFSAGKVLTESDLSQATADRFRTFVLSHLRWQGKKRFVNKHTGFPRIGYLKAIFPDAIFLHVLRDGRAVVSSLLKMHWWDGTLNSWWWGPMRRKFVEEYADSNESPVILAAIVWKTLLDDIFKESALLTGDDIMHIRYDTLIADYKNTMAEVADFCGLELSSRFRRRLNRFEIRRTDDRWKSELTPVQRRQAEESLSVYLEKYGFVQP